MIRMGIRVFEADDVVWSTGRGNTGALTVVDLELADSRIQRILLRGRRSVSEPEPFINAHVAPRINQLVSDPDSASTLPWRESPIGHLQLALDEAGNPIDVDSAPVLGTKPRRSKRYDGPLRILGAEHWHGPLDDPSLLACLDVSLAEGEIVRPTVILSPYFGERDFEAFAAAEIAPKLNRLHAEGPEHDGWDQVSTGHLQLSLVEIYPSR